MRKSLKALFVASAFVAGIAAAPTLYAHDSQASQGSTMGLGMMGGGSMMGGGNMMNMMSQMSEMMETCNKMMQDMTQRHQEGPKEPRPKPEHQE